MNPAIYIPILCVIIGIAAAWVSAYWGAQIGVKVALTEAKMRLDYADREITSLSGGMEKLGRRVTLQGYDIWTFDADLNNLCKEVKIDRVPRRYPDNG
jgi:hypothetical protein